MTEVPRVLTIQDMSSIGRCAPTVMIPIIRCYALPSGSIGNSCIE